MGQKNIHFIDKKRGDLNRTRTETNLADPFKALYENIHRRIKVKTLVLYKMVPLVSGGWLCGTLIELNCLKVKMSLTGFV